MAKKEDSSLFVGISGGNELRKSMLECCKGILESLKEHETFKDLRAEKLKLITQLKSEIKSLSKMITSLRTYLPKVKDIGIKKVEVQKPKEDKPKTTKAETPKPSTELEKLEAELSDIESKLNSLG